MSEEKSDDVFWLALIKKHWSAVLIFVLGFVGMVIGIFAVLLTFVANSDVGGYGTWNLGQFSIGTGLLWFLLLLLWEFLLVILPFIGFCCVLMAVYWFVVLSEEDKAEIKEREKKDKKKKRVKQGESGGASFLFFIAFLIVVFVEGYWLTPIGTVPYIYWIQFWLTGFVWVCIVFGIPIAVIVIIYLVYRAKKKSE